MKRKLNKTLHNGYRPSKTQKCRKYGIEGKKTRIGCFQANRQEGKPFDRNQLTDEINGVLLQLMH